MENLKRRLGGRGRRDRSGRWVSSGGLFRSQHPEKSRYTLIINAILLQTPIRVARCPVFDRTVRYFGSLSGIKMKVIPDNACVRYFQSLGILHFSYNL